jgi:hypothetical protein
MDGTNGSTSFIDSSSNALTPTVNGNTQISTTQSKFGGSAGLFDGTDDYLTYSYNSAFNFGTGDLTVEAWIYPTNVTGVNGVWGVSSGSGSNPKFVLFIENGTPKIHINYLPSFSNTFLVSSGTISINVWTHLAFVRSGSTWSFYINGVLAGTGSNSTDITFASSPQYVGYGGEGYFTPFEGYMDDVRITKGVARYTAAFTPPTESFPDIAPGADRYFSKTSLLLHMDGVNGGTTFTDSSSYGHTFTLNGSCALSNEQYKSSTTSFKGAASSAIYCSNSIFQFGVGDFTIEFWCYHTTLKHFTTIMGVRTANTSSNFSIDSDANGDLYVYGNTYLLRAGNGSLTTNTWQYITLTRKNGTAYIFVNGILKASAAMSNDFTTSLLTIGASSTFGDAFLGYLDEIRITKGVARYTANFTPPTEALPNAGSTITFPNSGLLAFWKLSDLTDQSGNGNTLTNNNSVTFDAGKIGNAAVFNGSTQYLNKTSIHTDASNISVAGWVRWTSSGSAGYMFHLKAATGRIDVVCDSSGGGRLLLNKSGDVVVASTVPSQNVWYHAAITVSGGTVKAYINGVLSGTSSDTISGVGDIYIGTSFEWINFGSLRGQVDAIGVWNRALTLEEIASLYAGGVGIEL